MRTYRFYCGNSDCRTRRELQVDGSVGHLFMVTEDDADEFDGQVWLCPKCREAMVP